MKSLQVRELPVDIYQALQKEAKLQHRSLTQQAIVSLARGLGMEQDNRERRRKLIDGFKRIPQSKNIKAEDVVRFIREDRER